MQEKLQKTLEVFAITYPWIKSKIFFGTYSLYKSNSEALMRKDDKFNKKLLGHDSI